MGRDRAAAPVGRPQARWLCEEASGVDGAEFLEVLDTPATERTVHHLDAMVARVRGGEPLQYVLGHWAFRRLDLMVDRRVLIPRPETEQLVELALDAAPRRRDAARRCVDLGTGSGAIGLSLVAELPLDGTTVWLTDASSDALDVARANAAGLGRRSVNVRFAEGSWFDALPDRPARRVATSWWRTRRTSPTTMRRSSRSVHEWEPHQALYAGADGLDAVRQIAADAPDWLAPGGVAGARDRSRPGRPRVSRCWSTSGLVDVRVLADLAGRDRFADGARPALAVSRSGRRPDRAVSPRRGRARGRRRPRRGRPRTAPGGARCW